MIKSAASGSVVTLCGFSINSKGRLVDFNLDTKTFEKEHSGECAFDLMHADDKLVYADWRIRKMAVLKGKSVVGTSEVMFRDYLYKKGT